MQVEVRNDVLSAFRELKRLIQRDRYEIEIKRRELHPKASDRRRAKQAAARKRQLEAAQRKIRSDLYYRRKYGKVS